MPTTDRAATLRDVLTRLYPELENAPAYLNERAPGLYDRLLGGRDDARAFADLVGVVPGFFEEYDRFQRGRPAEPVWGGVNGFPVEGGPAGSTFSDFGGPGFGTQADATGYDPGAFGAFLSAPAFLGVNPLGSLFSSITQGVNSIPAVQSFLSDSFPLTNADGVPVFGSNPLGGTFPNTFWGDVGRTATDLLSQLTGINLGGINTAFMTEGQLADADAGLGGTGGMPPSAAMDGGLSGAIASLAAGAEHGDTGAPEGFAGGWGPGGDGASAFGLGGGAFGNGDSGGGGASMAPFRSGRIKLFDVPQFAGSDSWALMPAGSLEDEVLKPYGGEWGSMLWSGGDDYLRWVDRWRLRAGGINRFGVPKGNGGDATGSTGDSSGVGADGSPGASGW